MAFHGGDIETAAEQTGRTRWLDFSANISPLGVPDSVKQAIVQAAEHLSHYPDPYQRRLRRALAETHRVLPEQIVCGNGGADIIFRTLRCLRPHRALLPVPCFSEYEEALTEAGCRVTRWYLPEPFQITRSVCEALENGCYDCLVLCNPNNPTGSVIEPELLESILETAKQKQMFVLMDECFYDMTEDLEERNSCIRKIDAFPNLLVVRSLTKRYAIPGLRLGYGICGDVRRIEHIRTTGQPWPVNTLAAEAACAVLNDKAYQMQFREFLQQARPDLQRGLTQLGFQVWDSHANFLFFRAKGMSHLDLDLQEFGILLRHCDTYPGLNADYYRAAVRLPEENAKLLSDLKSCLSAGACGGAQCLKGEV